MSDDDLRDDPRVRQVLELAAKGTSELNVPWELRDAVQWCIASELVKLQRAALVVQSPFPDGWLKAPDILMVIPPDESRENEAANWLLLTPRGGKELLRLRLATETPPPSRTKADKPATANERMAAMLQADPNLADLTANQWAAKLGCTAANVKQSKTWDTIRNIRLMQKAERATKDRGKRVR